MAIGSWVWSNYGCISDILLWCCCSFYVPLFSFTGADQKPSQKIPAAERQWGDNQVKPSWQNSPSLLFKWKHSGPLHSSLKMKYYLFGGRSDELWVFVVSLAHTHTGDIWRCNAKADTLANINMSIHQTERACTLCARTLIHEWSHRRRQTHLDSLLKWRAGRDKWRVPSLNREKGCRPAQSALRCLTPARVASHNHHK